MIPPDLAQRGQDVSLIMLQAEVVQVHVVRDIVEGVDTPRVIAGANATTADIQVQPRGGIDISSGKHGGPGPACHTRGSRKRL